MSLETCDPLLWLLYSASIGDEAATASSRFGGLPPPPLLLVLVLGRHPGRWRGGWARNSNVQNDLYGRRIIVRAIQVIGSVRMSRDMAR
ncbi:hypothetical protein BHE74_00028433 [Ensete ventricosum]|nr:hypothetical protein BHE74_00028433 [Ensete ventricosum]